MNWKHWLSIIASILLLTGIALGIREYITQRENAARAEEQKKASDQINALLKQQMQDRDVAYQKSLAQLQAQRRSVSTPQQAAQQLPTMLNFPEALRPITEDPLPNAPSSVKKGDVVLPQADLVPLFQKLNDCQQNELSLGKCTADLKDTTEIAAQNEAKAKAWEQAAKGGSWIKRTLRKAKVIACAGAGAGLGAAANQGPKGAAIGALGGATLCSLF